MSKVLKRKFREQRKAFKRELFIKARENPSFAILIIVTYSSWHHQKHIMQIWSMFANPEFRSFQETYNKNLFWKFLSGRDDIWKSLYFADRELHDKYRLKIPEVYAMGDALSVAYKVLSAS